jgi:hypothetical protein
VVSGAPRQHGQKVVAEGGLGTLEWAAGGIKP